MVPLLQRVTFEKRESNQSALAPFVRCLAVARHALAPVLLRGPAAIGHPWPGAANPASMPGCPLRRTSTRPHEGAKTATAPRGGLPAGLFIWLVRISLCRSRLAGDSGRSDHIVAPDIALSPASRLLQLDYIPPGDWSAVRPLSPASRLVQLDCIPSEIGRLSGRYRQQAGSYNWITYPRRLVGCQAVIASKPAPTTGLHTPGRLVGCQADIARELAHTGWNADHQNKQAGR